MNAATVLPTRLVLDGHGLVWEFELASRGWNDLPDSLKPGRVVQSYTDGSLDVCFDGVGVVVNVLPGEIEVLQP